MDIFSNVELWVAVLSGGVMVKIVDYLLPAAINRKEKAQNLEAGERHNLRVDIEYLRGQIEDLRKEVDDLRSELEKKTREVSVWQHRYWEKKILLDRVLIQVRHHGDDGIRRKVNEALRRDEFPIQDDE